MHTHQVWERSRGRPHKSLRDSHITKSTKQTLGGNIVGLFVSDTKYTILILTNSLTPNEYLPIQLNSDTTWS